MNKATSSAFVLVLTVISLSGCAAKKPISLTPQVAPSYARIACAENPDADFATQFANDEPRYTYELSLPPQLSLSNIDLEQRLLCTVLQQGTVRTLLLADTNESAVLWSVRFPSDSDLNIYGVESCPNGNPIIDLWYNGHSTIFFDKQSGREVWRYGFGSVPESPAAYRFYPGERYHLLISGPRILLVDPNSGKINRSFSRFNTAAEEGSYFDCPPLYNAGALTDFEHLLIRDNGIWNIDRETGDTIWSCRIPMYAMRYHTGENIGKAIGFGVLAAFTGVMITEHKGPSLVYPMPLVISSADCYFVSAMNIIYCLDKEKGTLRWAVGTNCGYATGLVAQNDKLYVSCCGVCDNQLLCLSLEDGSLVESFKSPFTKPVTLSPLSQHDLQDLTERSMWKRNEDCYNSWVDSETIAKSDDALQTICSSEGTIVASTRRDLYLLDAEDGAMHSKISHQVLVSGEILLLYSHLPREVIGVTKHAVFALDPKSGELNWIHNFQFSVPEDNNLILQLINENYILVYNDAQEACKGMCLDLSSGDKIADINVDELIYSNDLLATRKGSIIKVFTIN